jgi:hypothetical protein
LGCLGQQLQHKRQIKAFPKLSYLCFASSMWRMLMALILWIWWSVNESKFPNVDFLAWQSLGILSSHIEIEQTFSIACVLINLQWCCLGVENLDKLVMIYKNWLVDAWVNCKLGIGDKLGKFFVVEEMLLEENEELLEKASYFEEK